MCRISGLKGLLGEIVGEGWAETNSLRVLGKARQAQPSLFRCKGVPTPKEIRAFSILSLDHLGEAPC